jgi:hypothetical protein
MIMIGSTHQNQKSTNSLMLCCSRSFLDSLADWLSNASPSQSVGILLFPILPLFAASATATVTIPTPSLFYYSIGKISFLFHPKILTCTYTVAVANSIFSTFFPVSNNQEKIFRIASKQLSTTYCWYAEKFHRCIRFRALPSTTSAIRLPNNGSCSLREGPESFWSALYVNPIATMSLPLAITDIRWYAGFVLP